MPRADDPAGMQAVFRKLGAPETADKYEFAAPPEGFQRDEAFEKWARDAYHNLNLTTAQAKGLSESHNAYVKAQLEAQDRAYEGQVNAEHAELKQTWGAGYEGNLNRARQAAEAIGMTEEMIDGMEMAVGYKGTLTFLYELSKKMGEDSFVSDAARNSGHFTVQGPDQAKAEYENLRKQEWFSKALFDPMHPQHKQAKDHQTRLYKQMFPEPSNG
jgi:hypothetical protein